MKAALLSLALLATSLPLAAEDPRAADLPPPDRLIGMDLAAVVADLGSPDDMAVLRGEEEWQDDVVFSYDREHLSLYWVDARVWQVRLEEGFRGSAYGIRMGQSGEQVRELLGQPWQVRKDSLIYELEDRGYPIRLHLFFDAGRLVDLYCYRGDL